MPPLAPPNDGSPWYEDGLRFECSRCGNCCHGAPGVVWVDAGEVEALARRLDLDEAEFRRRYTYRLSEGGRSLTEAEDYACVFYDDQHGCTVYEDRPRQCRTWPFWSNNLASPATWEIEARDCPGMNQGPRHDLIRIRAFSDDDGLR